MSASGIPPWSVRTAQGADLPELAALERAAFPHPWSEDLISDELRQPGGLLLVASGDDGAVRAYAAFRLGAGDAELLRIATAPDRRGLGAARALLAHGLGQLLDRGAHRCHLEVRAENVEAIRLYEAAGFQPSGRRRGYYADGADAILFALELGALELGGSHADDSG